MKSALLAATGALLMLAGHAVASPIVSSYSGSYSIVSNSPATEGIVSLRLAIEPLFADCMVPGQCTELLLLNGVGAADSGAGFGLNLSTVLNAIDDGTQLFSFSMNFGSNYSMEASGGSMGLFAAALGDSYFGQSVDSATFTIDRLLFSPAASPLGTGTQVTLEYTLALHGIDPGPEAISLYFTPESDAQLLATPEPASWLMIAAGCGALWACRRKVAV